jgi:hypothetical protein
VTALGELQATNRGLGELLISVNFDGDERIAQLRAAAQRRAGEVIQRAQRAGRLRSDFQLADLISLMMANAGVIRNSAEPDSWRRHLTLVIEGLATRDGSDGRTP